MAADKQRHLWGYERMQLIKFISDLNAATNEQFKGILRLPYDALDALYNDLIKATSLISYESGGNGDLVDPARIAKVKAAHKAIIKSYLNSRYVTAVRNNGQVMRGRLSNEYPASESGERVFIDYEGKAWDLTNFKSWDPPLDQDPYYNDPLDGGGE